MKRNAKIIQISGLRGILTAIFIVTCLAAGFVVFPGFVAMNIWNHFSGNYVLNIYQGILLWAIIALICFIANKQRFSVSIETPKELSEEEMNLLMQRIKMQSQAKIINEIIKEEKELLENKEKSEDTVSK